MNSWLRASAVLVLWMSLLPEARAATPADEIVAQLNTLTKGHVYRGNRYAERVLYDRETIVKVELEPSKGWLGITVDDTQASAPVTVIVPLRETRVGTASEGSISFSCSSPCIRTTSDRFASAVQKLSAGRAAELRSAQQRNSIHFGCQAEGCVTIRKAILKLADIVKAR